MSDSLRVAVCQINPTVGDIEGNLNLALEVLGVAQEANAAVAVLPELAISGYPPEDLLLKPSFLADCRVAVEKFATHTQQCAALIGFADSDVNSLSTHRDQTGHQYRGAHQLGGAWNAVAVCVAGNIVGTYHKRFLPNYDVFDELRYFKQGDQTLRLFDFAGIRVGVTVCEDSWIVDGPIAQLAASGAQLVLNVNGSPYCNGKAQVRERVICDRVEETGVPVLYTNLVGGQDELLFDGGSFLACPTNAGPKITMRCNRFRELVEVIDVDVSSASRTEVHKTSTRLAEPLSELAERWQALQLGTRDFVKKNGFSDVCIGLSGGIDSALTAAIASDALGADHVHGVLLPSRYSSEHSVADAKALAANLGISTQTLPIEPAHQALIEILENDSGCSGQLGDLTDQNLQARIRGLLLMALANEYGWLVLATGNKSELAVGYSTLYGDTVGAFAVIKDLWKTAVYELCRWRNQQGEEIIPETVLTKPPSAELKPDQSDDQTLPPYETLDPILKAYVEDDHSITQIVEDGLGDVALVRQICASVDAAEFKRRQCPLGVRLSGKAFGRDRRMPIVNHYRKTFRND